MERRLAAIVAADVVGYSRLIRTDEDGTLATLKALQADLIGPKIAEHRGRVVKLMGDGILAEFASAVGAVRAGVELQQAVAERNAAVPKGQQIEFRIGVNLGDVVIDGDDIHGDGVNVAARLEGMAEPGGVYVSAAVHDQVRDRIEIPFEDLGEQYVKNIDRPVHVWRWVRDAVASLPGIVQADKPSWTSHRSWSSPSTT
jgi:adenylate cyclase